MYILSPQVYSCLFSVCVKVYRPQLPDGNPVEVNKYHIKYAITISIINTYDQDEDRFRFPEENYCVFFFFPQIYQDKTFSKPIYHSSPTSLHTLCYCVTSQTILFVSLKYNPGGSSLLYLLINGTLKDAVSFRGKGLERKWLN